MTEVAGKDATMWDIQTRDADGELKYFKSLKYALDYAKDRKTVWKISFDTPRDRVRLIRHWLDEERCIWAYEPLMDEVNEELRKRSVAEV